MKYFLKINRSVSYLPQLQMPKIRSSEEPAVQPGESASQYLEQHMNIRCSKDFSLSSNRNIRNVTVVKSLVLFHAFSVIFCGVFQLKFCELLYFHTIPINHHTYLLQVLPSTEGDQLFPSQFQSVPAHHCPKTN